MLTSSISTELHTSPLSINSQEKKKGHPVSGNFLHPRCSLSLFPPSKHFAYAETPLHQLKTAASVVFSANTQTTLAANNSSVVKFTPRRRSCPIIITGKRHCDILVSSFGGDNLKVGGHVGSGWTHRWTWQYIFWLYCHSRASQHREHLGLYST